MAYEFGTGNWSSDVLSSDQKCCCFVRKQSWKSRKFELACLKREEEEEEEEEEEKIYSASNARCYVHTCVCGYTDQESEECSRVYFLRSTLTGLCYTAVYCL